MKSVDEFRDPATVRALVKSITGLAGDDEFKFMEVCGGHTHTIYRHVIDHLLPNSIELAQRPGLPGVRDPDGPGGRRDVSIFCNHVTIVPPIKAILGSPARTPRPP